MSKIIDRSGALVDRTVQGSVIAKLQPVTPPSVFNNQETVTFDACHANLKAGRAYRVTGSMKIHFKTGFDSWIEVYIHDAPNSKTLYRIPNITADLNDLDMYFWTQSEIYVPTADESKDYRLKVHNPSGETIYYNWWSGGILYVEDLGPFS